MFCFRSLVFLSFTRPQLAPFTQFPKKTPKNGEKRRATVLLILWGSFLFHFLVLDSFLSVLERSTLLYFVALLTARLFAGDN
jgi:hypothetical protein